MSKKSLFHIVKLFVFSILFSILLLTLFSSSCFAADIETKTLFSGSSYYYNGYNIYVLLSAAGNSVMVKIDNTSEFIDLGLTKSDFDSNVASADSNILFSGKTIKYQDISIGLTKICFNIHKNSGSGDTSADCGSCCSRVNQATVKVEPNFEFEFSPNLPDIKVTRTYDKTEVTYGEEILVKVDVENIGTADANNFVYEENYPDSVLIVPSSSISSNGQTVQYSYPYIQSGKVISFSYKIKLKDTLQYSLVGKYNYGYKNFSYQKWTSSSSITLKDPITLKATFSQNTVKPDDELNLVYELQNNVEGDVSYNLTFDSSSLGYMLDILDYEDFQKNGNIYSLSGTLNSGENLVKTISIKPKEEGTYSLDSYLNSKYLIENPTKKLNAKFVSGTPTSVSGALSVLLSTKDSSLLETESSTLEIHMSKDDSSKISNILLTLSASNINDIEFFHNATITLDNLTDAYDNRYFEFILPNVNKTTTVTFKINGSYFSTSSTGVSTKKNIVASKSITVFPFQNALTFTHTLSPSTLKQNQTAKVTVSIKNNLDSRGFNKLYAFDTVPDQFIYKPIITDLIFNLEPLESKQIYSYELKAPYFINDSSSNITSTLISDKMNFSAYENLKTKIELKEPRLLITIIPEDKPSVGSITRVGFKIENTGELDAYDIGLSFPASREMELYNSNSTYNIDLLNPGENVEIYKEYRPKFAGNITIPGVLINTKDLYGNSFNFISSSKKLEIVSGNIDCYINADKSLDTNQIMSQKINLSANLTTVPVTIILYNNCLKAASVDIRADSFIISPQSSKKLTFNSSVNGQLTEIDSTYYSYYYAKSSDIDNPVVDKQYSSATNKIDSSGIKTAILLTTINDSNSTNTVVNTPPVKDPVIPKDSSVKKYIGSASPELLKGLVAIGIVVLVMFAIISFKNASKNSSSSRVSVSKNKFGKVSLSGTPEEDEKSLDQQLKAKISEVKIQIPVPKVGTNLQSIIDYIKEAKKANLPPVEIKHNLVSSGWDDLIVQSLIENEFK